MYPAYSQSDRLPIQALLVCGAASGAFTSFILTPIELIKCKMQVQSLSLYDSLLARSSPTAPTIHSSQASTILKRNIATSAHQLPGAFDLVLQVYRESGIAGFWRGQLGTLFRETGGSAAWFGAYEFASSLFRSRKVNAGGNAEQGISQIEAMLSGACAGIAYNISLFPADSVKSRMQTESIISSSGPQLGFWSVAKSMYQNGGIKVLYRGCGMTVARAAPSSAIIFLVYENLKVRL